MELRGILHKILVSFVIHLLTNSRRNMDDIVVRVIHVLHLDKEGCALTASTVGRFLRIRSRHRRSSVERHAAGRPSSDPL